MWYVKYNENDILHAASKKGNSATTVPTDATVKNLALKHWRRVHPEERRTVPKITITSIDKKNRTVSYYAKWGAHSASSGKFRY